MPDISLLDRVQIASPCTASWAAMHGDDRVRFCDDCKLNVYNLSAMTRPEAERLIREKEGRLCGFFYRRTDGTVLTKDCPVGLARARAALARGVTIAGAATTTLVCAMLAIAGRADASSRLRQLQPFQRIAAWLNPAPVPRPPLGTMIMGDIIAPPPPGKIAVSPSPANVPQLLPSVNEPANPLMGRIAMPRSNNPTSAGERKSQEEP